MSVNESVVHDSWTEYSWALGKDGRDLVKTTDLGIAMQMARASGAEVYARRVTATGWRALIPVQTPDEHDLVRVDVENLVAWWHCKCGNSAPVSRSSEDEDLVQKATQRHHEHGTRIRTKQAMGL